MGAFAYGSRMDSAPCKAGYRASRQIYTSGACAWLARRRLLHRYKRGRRRRRRHHFVRQCCLGNKCGSSSSLARAVVASCRSTPNQSRNPSVSSHSSNLVSSRKKNYHKNEAHRVRRLCPLRRRRGPGSASRAQALQATHPRGPT